MKINWTITIALVVIVVISYWAIDSLRIRTYSGTNLSFAFGTGPVTVTNPSDAAVAAQITGAGSRTFTVSSATEGLTGSSTRQGNGISSTQLFAFQVPPGVSSFIVARGNQPVFTNSDGATLEVSVQPVNDEAVQTTLLVTAVAILGSLFFISRATHHSWLQLLRGKKAEVLTPVAATATSDSSQGPSIRSYGDNSPSK
ncbi:MAG: hypothetical protein U0694_03145 [Anaerolineae bacterium]